MAALIPVAVVVAARATLAPSQMLMPLAFSAHAGSMLALTGTPVNIIVSDAAADAGARPFGYFEFALAGVPLLVGTVLVIVLLGLHLLPERTPAAELVGSGRGVTEVVVAPRSPLIGQHLFAGMATPSGDLVVLAVQRAGDPVEGPDETLRSGDTLLLSGTWENLHEHTAFGAEVLVVDDPALLRRGVSGVGRGGR